MMRSSLAILVFLYSVLCFAASADLSPYCQRLAAAGYCVDDVYAQCMWKHCPTSCWMFMGQRASKRASKLFQDIAADSGSSNTKQPDTSQLWTKKFGVADRIMITQALRDWTKFTLYPQKTWNGLCKKGFSKMGLSFKIIANANYNLNCAEANSCQPRRCPIGGFQGYDCQCYCDSGSEVEPVRVCDESAMIPDDADPSTCEDRNPGCPQWARNGYCYTLSGSVNYMKANCQFSCNFCPKMSTAAAEYDPTQPCTDKYRDCAIWAALGECENELYYMNDNCKASCNTCTCRDLNISCPNWSPYCDNILFKDYLQKNCRKSCGYCKGTNISDQRDSMVYGQIPELEKCFNNRLHPGRDYLINQPATI